MPIICKTEAKASLKLLNHINSFMFEEECRELKWFTEPQKKHLKDAAKALCKIIDKHWSMKLIKSSYKIIPQEAGLEDQWKNLVLYQQLSEWMIN